MSITQDLADQAAARAMRISIANWSTTAEDVDRSADAILAVVDGLVSPPDGAGRG